MSHTLHLTFHSRDKYRTAVLITHSKCDHEDFELFEGYQPKSDKMKVFKHKDGVLVLSCDKSVKTWIGKLTAPVVFELVTCTKF